MWPSIRRWLDWAMNELVQSRPRTAEQAVHVRYEKAGLTLHAPPVPWNADAVLVELTAALPPAARLKTDFTLRIPGQSPIPAEVVRKAEGDAGPFRVIFRTSVPPITTDGEILWKSRLLTTVHLPIQTREQFLLGLRVSTPTCAVRLGDEAVAAQTFPATQNRGLVTSLVLRSAGPLAPLADVGVEVEFAAEDTPKVVVQVPLSASQLASKEALLTAVAPKVPRRAGPITVIWRVGGQVVHIHRLTAVTLKRFLESLRVSDARYVIADHSGTIRVVRLTPPMADVARIGPCFLVASREPGAAGYLNVQVTAVVPGAVQSPVLLEERILLTDGPTVVAPGLVAVSDLGTATGFELRHKGRVLGVLSFSPVPEANFTSEGGFVAPPEFAWTTSAEDELAERLGKLFGGI